MLTDSCWNLKDLKHWRTLRIGLDQLHVYHNIDIPFPAFVGEALIERMLSYGFWHQITPGKSHQRIHNLTAE